MENRPEETFSHQSIQNTQNDSQEGVLCDPSLENTLTNKQKNDRYFKTRKDQERGWLWNGKLIKTLGGTGVEIGDQEFALAMIIRKSFLIQQRVLQKT